MLELVRVVRVDALLLEHTVRLLEVEQGPREIATTSFPSNEAGMASVAVCPGAGEGNRTLVLSGKLSFYH